MATLTLNIEGPPGRVPASTLATVLTESLHILEDLRRSVARNQQVKWYVTGLRMGSAVAVLAADDLTDAPLRVSHEYIHGLGVVESGEGLPSYFPDSSLTSLVRMTKVLGSDDARSLRASIGQDGESEVARVTKAAGAHVGELRSPRAHALGSITGILDTISLRGQRPKFQVLDPVSRRPVMCQFSTARTEAVKEVLGRRVTVQGTIIRNAKGQPLRVEEPAFEVVAQTPPLTGLVGIDPEFTGGLPLDKYMELVRAW